MRIRWTERASSDLLSIHTFIAEQSESYADAVYERLLVRPQQLVDQPLSGSIVPEYGRDDIREVFLHSFRLIYLVVADEVQILTVAHGARILDFEPPVR
ncbi:MAG: type II toxin-antitoxin system RelE/ParE family toxin [Planctomycetota bacterium]|nr:type II toxin-antitoxin system RelE/ParE family toxin [Planctomycetota bacterium]